MLHKRLVGGELRPRMFGAAWRRAPSSGMAQCDEFVILEDQRWTDDGHLCDCAKRPIRRAPMRATKNAAVDSAARTGVPAARGAHANVDLALRLHAELGNRAV